MPNTFIEFPLLEKIFGNGILFDSGTIDFKKSEKE
jgi:hypothetical protein